MSNPVKFIKEAYAELQKVTWPNKKQATNYTLVVIGGSIAVAIFLGLLDMFFSSIVEKFIF